MKAFTRRTYIISKNRLTLEQTTSIIEKPRKIDFNDFSKRTMLLEEFTKVTDTETLYKFAKRFELPTDTDVSHVQELSFGKLTPENPLKILVSVHYFLSLAAKLRWLSLVLRAVQERDHERLKSWVQISDYWQIFAPIGTQSKPLRQLSMELSKAPVKLIEREDWILCQDILADHPPFTMDKEQLERANTKKIFDFARYYIAFQINELMKPIHPAVHPDGKPYFEIENAFQAMCLVLYDRYTGAGVSICNNPHCPKRFYVVKRKGNRAPRSDRQYCDRSACQKWGRKHIGTVRFKHVT